jgi:hypothetical protein
VRVSGHQVFLAIAARPRCAALGAYFDLRPAPLVGRIGHHKLVLSFEDYTFYLVCHLRHFWKAVEVLPEPELPEDAEIATAHLHFLKRNHWPEVEHHCHERRVIARRNAHCRSRWLL